MCHVVSSNSYKNLPADRWIHTTDEKGAGVYRQWEKERQTFPFRIQTQTHVAENVPRILDKLLIWEVVLIVKCGFMKWLGWSELQNSCLWINFKLSQKHLWERSEDELTVKRWFWKKKKKKRRAQFSTVSTESFFFLRLTEHRQSD